MQKQVEKKKYYVVRERAVPEVLLKVVEAKRLLESNRVAVKTEPYPGRWTTHFAISSSSDLDEELFDWIEQAYQFAQEK